MKGGRVIVVLEEGVIRITSERDMVKKDVLGGVVKDIKNKLWFIESEEDIMIAINLVDSVDGNTHYGILLCENNSISEKALREKIYEIKDEFENRESDWIIGDIIDCFPKEWKVYLQEKYAVLVVWLRERCVKYSHI